MRAKHIFTTAIFVGSAFLSGCGVYLNTTEKIRDALQEPADEKPPKIITSPGPYGFGMMNGNESNREKLAKAKCKEMGYGSLFVPNGTRTKSISHHTVFYSYQCIVRPQPQLTGIGLRALQTRSFDASLSKVLTGILEHAADKNGDCYTEDKHPVLKKGDSTEDGYRVNCKIGREYYQHWLARKSDKIHLRTRMSLPNSGVSATHMYSISNSTVQLTEPQPYQRFFKEIADQMFIEAVELTPMEMR